MERKEKIIKQIEGLKNGAFFRLTYESDLPVAAAMSHLHIRKIASVITRTGVKYRSIAKVAEKPASTKVRSNPYEWIIANKLKRNTKNNNEYLVIAPTKHNTERIKYLVVNTADGTVTLADQIEKSWVVDSYWTKEEPAIKTIKIDNIISIN